MNQAAPKSIHLPRATDAPAVKDFKQLSETAKENCGSRVELTWSMPRSTKSFRITVKRDQSNDEAAPPLWILREIDGPEAREIWRAETSDINVVRDACYKHSGPPAATKAGSAGKSGGGGKSGQAKATAAPKAPAAAVKDNAKEKVETAKSPVKTPDTPAETSTQSSADNADSDKTQSKEGETASDSQQGQQKDETAIPPISSPPVEPEQKPQIDQIIEEDPAPKAVTARVASDPKKSEAVAALTQELSDLMELEVELDINEVDVPPAVANETAPKIEIPKSELAAVDRMRKIIEARQTVSAVREMKADLKLPLISKNPQEEPAKQATPRATHEEFDIPHIAAALPPVHPQDEVVDDEFADDPKLIDEDASLYQAFGEDGEGARLLDSQLISPKSAFYAATAFFKFLEHEFYRFETDRTPLSLVIFEMQHQHEISSQAATAAALRIGLVKRKLDIIGHFGPDEYAILLPNSNGTTAALIASRVHDALTASPLAEHFDNSSIRYLFGIANLPDNGDDIPSLINAARSAKEHAKKTNGAIVLARSLV